MGQKRRLAKKSRHIEEHSVFLLVPFLRIGAVVFKEKSKFLRKVLKFSKASQKITKNNKHIHFHNTCFFKQDLKQANKAATHAFNLLMFSLT